MSRCPGPKERLGSGPLCFKSFTVRKFIHVAHCLTEQVTAYCWPVDSVHSVYLSREGTWPARVSQSLGGPAGAVTGPLTGAAELGDPKRWETGSREAVSEEVKLRATVGAPERAGLTVQTGLSAACVRMYNKFSHANRQNTTRGPRAAVLALHLGHGAKEGA